MITRVDVENFKSLQCVSVELTPLTILIGRSGTGKSNFVRALRLLRDVLRGDLQQILGAETLPAYAVAGDLTFRVYFTIPHDNRSFKYEVGWKTARISQSLGSFERLTVDDEILFEIGREDGRSQKLKWVKEPPLVERPTPQIPMLGKMPGIEEAVLCHVALTRGIGCYDFPGDVLAVEKRQSVIRHELADDGGNYLTVMQSLLGNLQEVQTRKRMVSTLQAMNRTLHSVELDSIQDPRKAIISHAYEEGNSRLQLQLNLESEGFRRFYAHLLALNQSPPLQTVIFEEPEKGIYPGALSILADEIRNAVTSGRTSVILTTHSPQLLDHFRPEELRIVEIKEHRTKIGALSNEQIESVRDNLLSSGELLTVDPARIAQ